MLYDLGLKPAVEWLSEQMGKRYGLAVEVDGTAGLDIDPAVATTAFRGIRELLTNVWKHANVRRAG